MAGAPRLALHLQPHPLRRPRLRRLATGTEIEETVGGSFVNEDRGECGGLGWRGVYNRLSIIRVAGFGKVIT